MFIDIANIPTEVLQNKLTEKNKYKSKDEKNFLSDKNSHIACFISAPQQYIGLFFVTNQELKPFLCFKTEAYIDECYISESGKYAAIRTCRNPDDNKDSRVIILLDLEAKEEIGRSKFETMLDTNLNLRIDERLRILCLSYGNLELQYNFDGRMLNEDLLTEYYKLPYLSPYTIDKRVNFLLDKVTSDECLWNDVQYEVFSLLERLKSDFDFSHYQLSLTYKKLGTLLSDVGDVAGAILSYETGLALNPKLSVKKALGKLKKANPDISVPTPKIPSIEMEKRWESDEYVLPSTLVHETSASSEPVRTEFDDDFSKISYQAFYSTGKSFIESLKSDGIGFCESIPNLETMSDKDFTLVFNKLCDYLNTRQRKDARKMSEKIILRYSSDNALSIREEIILNLHSMILSCTGIVLKSYDEITR